jgi:hypothetical protein
MQWRSKITGKKGDYLAQRKRIDVATGLLAWLRCCWSAPSVVAGGYCEEEEKEACDAVAVAVCG